jgi:YVTN family beta-propeller protein
MITETKKKVLLGLLIVSFLLITAISPITQASFISDRGSISTLSGISAEQQIAKIGSKKYQMSSRGGFREGTPQNSDSQNYIESTLDIWNNTILQGNVLGNTTPSANVMAFDPLNNYTYVTDPMVNGVTVLNSANVIIDSINVGPRPNGIVYNPANGEIYVANTGSDTLSLITSNNQVKGNITVAPSPNGIAYDPMNRYLYVACYDFETGGMVTVINSTNNIIANISVQGNPKDVAFDSLNNYIYVTTLNGVSVIDSSNKVVTNISGIPYAYNIAFDPVNQEMFLSHEMPWSVALINTTTNSIILNLSYPNFIPKQISFNPSNGYMYIVGSSEVLVVNSENNIVLNIAINSPLMGVIYIPTDEAMLVSSQLGELYLISPNNSIINSIGIGSEPTDIAYDAFNHELYFSESGMNAVAVIGASGKIVKNISVGNDPNGVLYDSYNNYVYVANTGSGTISIIAPDDSIMGNITFSSFIIPKFNPYSIALDTYNGFLYVTTTDSNLICLVNPLNDTIATSVPSVGSNSYSYTSYALSPIAFNPVNGDTYIACYGFGILVEDSTGNGIILIKVPIALQVGYDPYNQLIYATTSSSSVCIINSQNEIIGNLTIGFPSNGISYDSSTGGMLVIGEEGNNEMAVISSSNSLTSVYAVGDFPMSVIYDTYNGNFYTVNKMDETLSILAKNFPVTFDESGLSSGTSWSATLNGKTESSTNDVITFSESNGTYPYSIGTVAGYVSSLHSGQVTINGSLVSLQITFTAIGYTVTFSETGLPGGNTWYVNLTNNQTFSSTATTISFSEPNGLYSYTIETGNKTYSPLPNSGSFEINGSRYSKNVTFSLVTYTVTFTEGGLPSGMKWFLNITGENSLSTTGTSITESLPNGSYSYTVGTVNKNYASSPRSGTFSVTGSEYSKSVTFNKVTYVVSFVESGLPSGIRWYVNITGQSPLSSTSVTLTAYEINGTYSYSVGCGNQSFSASEGQFAVAGANLTVSIEFKVSYAGIFDEKGLPTGTTWSVILNSVEHDSTSSSITFLEPNGTFSYSIMSISGYNDTPSSGYITINGSSVTIMITFTKVIQKGYFVGSISPPNASVWINGTLYHAVNGQFNISLSSGTYEVKVSAPGYATYTTNITISSSSVSKLPVQSLTKMTTPSSFSFLLIAVIAVIVIAAIVAVAVVAMTRSRRKRF